MTTIAAEMLPSTATPRATPGPDRLSAGSIDEALSIFTDLRPRLCGIAYRILRSAADADDVVQNVWLRWQTTDRSVVMNAAAFLATTTARLAVNLAKAARSRRETYVGPCLPEPIDTSSDPQLGAERDEVLEFAVLVLLEKLSPKERAAYVLREAFHYPFRQLADMLQLEVANVRQLVRRARRHIASGRRVPVDSAEQKRLLTALVAAAQSGDSTAMESLLVSEVVSYSNGGGVVRPARFPVFGHAAVANYMPRSLFISFRVIEPQSLPCYPHRTGRT